MKKQLQKKIYEIHFNILTNSNLFDSFIGSADGHILNEMCPLMNNATRDWPSQ